MSEDKKIQMMNTKEMGKMKGKNRESEEEREFELTYQDQTLEGMLRNLVSFIVRKRGKIKEQEVMDGWREEAKINIH